MGTPSYLDFADDGDGRRATYRRVSLVAGLIWGISSLALVKLVIWGTVEVARSSDPEGLLEAVAASEHAPWPWLGFLAALIGFIPLAVLLPIAIERYHHRSWRTSMTPFLKVNVGQIMRGLLIFGGLYLVVAALTTVILRESISVQFDLGRFLPGLLVLVGLAWVQAFGQELLFRGYNMQWAWLDTKVPGVLATISGLAFGVPFLFAPWIVQWVVPEVQVPDAPWAERLLLMVGYVCVGAALAMASIRTGTIELAIGAAFAFNVLTALLLAPRSGQMAGGSLVEVSSGELPTLFYVALLAVACLVFARLARRLAPDPTGRPLIRDAAAADVLSLPPGNPIWLVSVRNLLQHRVRLIVTLVTIALSVTFITATLVFADTTSRALDLFFDTEPADVVVQPIDPVTVFGDGGRPPALSFDESVAADLREVPGVSSVSPSVNQEGVAILDPETGEPVGGATSAHIGASWVADQLPEGTADLVAELPRGPDQVAIDSTTADRLGLVPGDTVNLVTPLAPDAAKDWTVTGVVDIGLAGGATVAVFDLPTAQALITGPGRVNQLLVATDTDPAAVALRINETLGPDAEVQAITGRQAADQAAAEVADGIGFLNTLLTVFGVIAAATAVFLIFNTFSMVVAQRNRELALLRAVGARSDQVQIGVLIQAILLGLVGTVIGVGLGLYLAVGLRSGLRWFDIDVPGGSLVVSPKTLLIAALIGVGATALAAWAPAVRASQTSPVDALQQGQRLSREAIQRRIIIAVAAAALALATAIVALRDSLPQNAVAWMGLSAMLAIGAFVLAAPWFVRPVLAVLGLPLRSTTARLAMANARRNPRRVTATTAALTIGIALIGLITVLTTSATATADNEIDNAFGSDLSIGIPPLYRPFDHAITERAAAVPGVAESTFIRTTAGQRQEIPVPVFGVDPSAITNAVNLTAESGDLADIGGRSIALDSRLAARYGLKVGSDFTAEFRTGRETLRVVAIFDPVVVFQGILTDLALAQELGAPRDLDTAAYFRLTPDADPAMVRAQMEDAIAANPAIQVQDTQTLKQNFADTINQLLGFVFAMLALAVLIAVLSIINTLLLSVTERASEIGLLRAIGATQQQVRRMIVLESAILGVFGAVCGAVLGIGYGLLMRIVMEPLGITTVAVPWGWIVVFIVGGALAGVLAAAWPAVSASKVNILDAVAAE